MAPKQQAKAPSAQPAKPAKAGAKVGTKPEKPKITQRMNVTPIKGNALRDVTTDEMRAWLLAGAGQQDGGQVQSQARRAEAQAQAQAQAQATQAAGTVEIIGPEVVGQTLSAYISGIPQTNETRYVWKRADGSVLNSTDP